MGSGITINCSKCSYEVDATLGIGFSYGDLRNVIDCIPTENQQKVIEILDIEKHSVQKTDFRHELMRCPNCRRMQGLFYYRIEYDNGNVLESSSECSQCNVVMAPYKGSMRRIPLMKCPECNEAFLITKEHVPWD